MCNITNQYAKKLHQENSEKKKYMPHIISPLKHEERKNQLLVDVCLMIIGAHDLQHEIRCYTFTKQSKIITKITARIETSADVSLRALRGETVAVP